jgi:hypothetical protein
VHWYLLDRRFMGTIAGLNAVVEGISNKKKLLI